MHNKTYLENDKFSFLGRPFSIELPVTAKECIERIEDETTSYPLAKPQKSRLELVTIDDTKYLFRFDGLGDLRSLHYTGIIEQITTDRTKISGSTRLSDSAILRNTDMIVLTLLFITIPYISAIFFVITAISIYSDVKSSQNAAQKLGEAILKNGQSRPE